MTEQLIAAAQQALEALESFQSFVVDAHILEGKWYWLDGTSKAITDLRTAIEAAEKQQALDKKAENARELGLDYEPAQQQEPVAWINWCAATGKRSVSFECESELASQPLYEGITQNTQYHYSKFHSWFDSELHRQKYTKDHPAYLAAQEAWNAANDAAQHRINRLNAEIEAWKVRFKIAEDALAKLNGPEQKPVAWVGSLKDPQPHCVTDLKYCSAAQWDTGYHLKYIPLYTSPQPSKPWVGLTDEDKLAIRKMPWEFIGDLIVNTEAKLREKNGGAV